MSFGGFGSGGFGSSQNNQTSSAFGGFGQTSTSGGFGSTSTAFGAPAGSSGGLFGNNNTSNSSSTFGGFGATQNNSSPFGQSKPAFGATSTGGSLFGGGSTTTANNTGFGGFGNAGSTGFGQTASTGAFGAASKPAFGASSGSGLFGGSTSGTSTTGFGTTAPATSAFGSSSPFASNQQNNGTQNPQFSPFTEKEANATNQYQTITAMPAYNKFQVEELRLVDYAQGRKYGNGSAQAGAFGTSSGFGGFSSNQAQPTGFGAASGSTGGGLFGNNNTNNNATSTPFGGASNTTSTFGSSNNTGGGLFGAKPAGTGLFGNTTASTAPAAGGLFGTSGGFGNNSGGGFGATATSAPAFGQGQSKSLFGAGTSTGFGNSTGTGTSLFGNNNTNPSSAFGQTQQSAPAGGFSFGQQNSQQQQQQPQQTQQSGGLFGGFGNNNQAKPGGLFGASSNTTTTGGLFGQQQQPTQQQTGGLFGSASTQQSGGLFGNKPASSGLFGASNSTTGGGLFGNNSTAQQQPQQAAAGGLFGSTNNQTGTSLFGAKPAASGLGGGLFGQNTNQQQPASSLFGNSQQPQQNGQLGSSLFGSTNQQQPMQQSQNNHLVASLNDNPYGNYQLFASLNTPSQSPGPLATPVGPASTARKQAIIPHYRVVPHASSRLLTPQKRPQSYGFTYSNYNSPMSPATSASPGSSLLGGSTILGRSVAKSLSASNLRHSYSAQESILSPGAFTNNRSGPGNMKKLNINRTLSQRRSLFANDPPAAGLNKRVSFEREPSSNSTQNEMSGALIRTEQVDEPAADSDHSMITSQNGDSAGKELAIVPEDPTPAVESESSALHSENRKARLLREDQTPGEYIMEPHLEKLRSMSRQQRAAVKNFTVKREGVGEIVFSQVDLSNVPLEQICGEVVELNTRQATVYGDKSPIRTPPQGQGLNVPSTITLENSWPRQKGGRLKIPDRKSIQFEKHVRILKSAKDTRFVSYDEVTGRWTFHVDHYTTYGLDYDDDDDSAMTTTISHDANNQYDDQAAPEATQSDNTPELRQDESLTDSQGSGVDDTFDFKRPRTKHVPGEFEEGYLEEVAPANDEGRDTNLQDFRMLDETTDFDPFLQVADLDSYQSLGDQAVSWDVPQELAGPVKPVVASTRNDNNLEMPTPSRIEQLWLGGDWTEHLQHTTSPAKHGRSSFRQVQLWPENLEEQPKERVKQSGAKSGFESTIDIMKSLFDQTGSAESGLTEAQSFIQLDNQAQLSSQRSVKTGRQSNPASDKYAQFAETSNLVPGSIKYQRSNTDILASKAKSPSAPQARPRAGIDFSKLAQFCDTSSTAGQHEQSTWQLASILFGENNLPDSLAATESASDRGVNHQIRKEKLAEFWKSLVQHESQTAAQFGKTLEEKSLLQLIGGDVVEACATLLSGQNFHLAQLVAQLPGDQTFRDAINQQIETWRKRTDWSEMTDAVRAIYEILAGHVCDCRGLSMTGQENKATTFKFSTRYRYDWRRAFGLRLWFGVLKADDLAYAVAMYSQELAEYKESAIPTSWFLLRLEDQGWTDPDPNAREDILWSLLKLYASAQELNDAVVDDSNNLKSMFAPESVGGHPLDARLSFQLLSTMMVSPKVSIDQTEASKVLDELALTYADVLESQVQSHPEYLITVAWVLLHLSNQNTRSEQVRTLLDRHANLLDPATTICKTLTAEDGLQIPYVWICSSLAKHAETVSNDPVAQTRWLIEGGEHVEAHEVVCRKIGPEAIISLDYDSLRETLSALSATDVRRKVDWDTGAGLYLDFLELADLQGAGQNGEYRSRMKQLVKKLTSNLEASSANVEGGQIDREEKIALKLMAEEILSLTQREKMVAVNNMPTLSLTESGYLKQSMAASVRFYEALALKV